MDDDVQITNVPVDLDAWAALKFALAIFLGLLLAGIAVLGLDTLADLGLPVLSDAAEAAPMSEETGGQNGSGGTDFWGN